MTDLQMLTVYINYKLVVALFLPAAISYCLVIKIFTCVSLLTPWQRSAETHHVLERDNVAYLQCKMVPHVKALYQKVAA